ncbi:disease resistance protein RUN1 [Trifolium repens]|nr:disease resistance protein RUN1 [Trifolium repens]
MASSSNSFPALALVTLPKKRNNYDVFVTFRGEDTRNNITDFLFSALEDKGVSVFRDDTNLPKGESIGPELLCAIEDSQIFVVIFSKNYASSTCKVGFMVKPLSNMNKDSNKTMRYRWCKDDGGKLSHKWDQSLDGMCVISHILHRLKRLFKEY